MPLMEDLACGTGSERSFFLSSFSSPLFFFFALLDVNIPLSIVGSFIAWVAELKRWERLYRCRMDPLRCV